MKGMIVKMKSGKLGVIQARLQDKKLKKVVVTGYDGKNWLCDQKSLIKIGYQD